MPDQGVGLSERVYQGVGVTPLSGVGSARWYDADSELTLPVAPETIDAAAEHTRFQAARNAATEEVSAERDGAALRLSEEEAEIFDAHAQFLNDPQITDRVTAAIEEEDLPAPHAVYQAFADAIETFESAGGMLAERAEDLRDVRDRLLRLLLDVRRTNLSELPSGSVLLADRLTPSDTAQLDPECVAGFATIAGGRTSHAAIMARSLGIPAVVGVGEGLHDIEEYERIVVDGLEGSVVVAPTDTRVAASAREQQVELRTEPVTTADGRAVEVGVNVGTPVEVSGAAAQGADGIGLFRTEFLFLDREAPPDEEEQYEAYCMALEAFPEGRVVVRTLDVGGDKPIHYLDTEPGENPFLGVRGVRLVPGVRPDLLETQLRALLRAAATDAGDGLAIMFPLVTTVKELEDLVSRVDTTAATLDDEGLPHAIPELGVMVETPAATYIARELAQRVDFLSLGTNDLTQYVMAAARDDKRVATLHDPYHPPVLRAIDRTVREGHAGGAWVGMCGEMAGDPALTELLVGLGLNELSASAVTVPSVKSRIEGVSSASANALAERALNATTREEVHAILEHREETE